MVHQLVVSTAAAARALSCGTGDRMENERAYLGKKREDGKLEVDGTARVKMVERVLAKVAR